MIPFIKFISQWTSYEENAPRIDSKTEYAYIYTPFLLVATDAREKFLAGQEVSVVDGKKLLTPYQDYLVFGITLLGNTQHFDKISKCFLNTGNVLINSYQVLTGEAIKTPWFPEQPYYMAKYYVYFPNKEITLNRPVTVTLVTVDKHEHRFYFNLDNVK